MKIALPYHIGFTDGLKEFRLTLQDGARGLAESGSQPSTLAVTGGGTRTGDFEPNFSHIEQRTWHGGRGQKYLVDDPTRFLDSRELCSWFPDKIFPAPKWFHAKGLRTVDEYVSNSMGWLALVGDNRYAAMRSTNGFNGADKVNLWIKRRGNPGTLTVELRSTSGSYPHTTVLAGPVTVDTDTITDVLSLFREFDWTGTVNLTTYYIVIYGASGDDIDNCWLVGVEYSDSGSGQISNTGGLGAWVDAYPGFNLNYRVTDVDTARRFIPFQLRNGQYIVSVNEDGSNSKIFINGDRGTATSATSTTLVDSAKTWVSNRWQGALVAIIGGKGKGQVRTIVSNTGTTLTVDKAWDINPDATSLFVIYKTPWFTEITVSGATWGAVQSVAVINQQAYFALGQSVNLARMQVSGNTHQFKDDGTNKADLMASFFDTADGPQIIRANNDTSKISRATPVAWASNHAFGDEKAVGSVDSLITNFADYDSILWVAKEDGVWTVQNDVPRPFNVGLGAIPGPETGQAIAVHDLFLLFSWWKSIEQLYGGTLDDIGPWAGEGLPGGRDGYVSGMVSLLSWLFVGIDARDGTSGVYAYKDRGYHDVFRGYKEGHRVRGVFVQPQAGYLPRLWIDYNGELIYQDYSLTPLEESNYPFMHEAVVIGSLVDMGHADTFKFFKEINAFVENLDKAGIHVEVDYQYGDDLGTDNWLPAPSMYISPTDSSAINLGEVSTLSYRLRLQTDDAYTPPIVRSTIVKGYEVLPVKKIWSMRVKASSLRVGGREADPHELYEWLWESTQRARRVWMYSLFPELNGVLVRVEPPSTLWRFINRAARWTGQFQLTVREM